jgi:hypothetical protein
MKLLFFCAKVESSWELYPEPPGTHLVLQLYELRDLRALSYLGLWSVYSANFCNRGLWKIISSSLQLQSRTTKWLGWLVIIIVGLAVILPLALVSPEYRASVMWCPALIGYAVMGLLILAYVPGAGFWANAIVVMARVGGMAGGALISTAYFPFCQLKGKPFGVTYLVVGCIGGILATRGMFYFWGKALRDRPAVRETELAHTPSGR